MTGACSHSEIAHITLTICTYYLVRVFLKTQHWLWYIKGEAVYIQL